MPLRRTRTIPLRVLPLVCPPAPAPPKLPYPRFIRLGLVAALTVLFAPLTSVSALAQVAPPPELDHSRGPRSLPRHPSNLPAFWTGTVHTTAMFPVNRSSLCPDTESCIFEAAGGVGLQVERRWVWGLSLGAVYDVLFLDTEQVFEQGFMQSLRATARYLFALPRQFHPYLGASFGVHSVGDFPGVSTAGLVLEMLPGIEMELTEYSALSVSVPMRAFSAEPFRTDRDGVERKDARAVSFGIGLQLGLTLMEVR